MLIMSLSTAEDKSSLIVKQCGQSLEAPFTVLLRFRYRALSSSFRVPRVAASSARCVSILVHSPLDPDHASREKRLWISIQVDPNDKLKALVLAK